MSAPRVTRVTGNSKAGRQLRARNHRTVVGSGPTPQQQEWNARVDAERQAKEGEA